MTSPVSAIGAIEKALAKVELREWFAGGVSDEGLTVVDDGLSHGIFPILAETHEANFIAACNPVAMRELLALARQAEALQRENAELREALQNLMGCYDTPLSRRRFPPDDFMNEALNIARTLLGGSENAE